jgi:hypothetical protein
MADDILSKLTLPKVESELAARRRDVAALVKIRQALRRKAAYEDAERRLSQKQDGKGGDND